MLKIVQVKRLHVRPGDVLIDQLGRRYFRVTEIFNSRARGYLVFYGVDLANRNIETVGGNKTGLVTVEREW